MLKIGVLTVQNLRSTVGAAGIFYFINLPHSHL